LCEDDGICQECGCEDAAEYSSDDAQGSETSSSLDQQKERQEAALAGTASSLGGSFVMAGSLMMGNPATFVSLFMTVELLSYLPLINMDLTPHQVDLLVGANQAKDLPDYIPSLGCSPTESPRKNYDFDCSSFLRISQKELTILSGVGLLSLVSWIAACALKDGLSRLSETFMKVLPLARKLLLMVFIDSLIKAAYSAQLSGINSVADAFSWCMMVVVWLLYLALGGVGCLAACSKSSSYPHLKHFLFNNLKPTISSRLHFSLLILHRTAFALTLIVIDAPKEQLFILSAITAAVIPSQFTVYLLVLRPYQDIKESILQIGTHCVVTAFCIFLTLYQYSTLGDDRELVSKGIMWSLMSIICLHVLAILAKLASVVKEILEHNNEELPMINSI
jgi:hypothetical protein